jgi:hypothetical protein
MYENGILVVCGVDDLRIFSAFCLPSLVDKYILVRLSTINIRV